MGRGGLLQTESRSLTSADARGHLAPPARARGAERTYSLGLRPGSYKHPVPAVLAGPAANGTGCGTNMCPAAPQEARPDLPSSPCPTQPG